jgi:hypothetical protein
MQHPDRLGSNSVQLSACLRVLKIPQQRIAVVGNGNIDVGSESLTRKPGQSTVDDMSGSLGSSERRIDSSLKKGREGIASGLCGAMSQQGGEFRGNVSAPQKFLHLVGCRDRKVAQALNRKILEKGHLERQSSGPANPPNRVER